MICPNCGTVLDISADGTRGYCSNRFCHAMVKLDDQIYGIGGNDENIA